MFLLHAPCTHISSPPHDVGSRLTLPLPLPFFSPVRPLLLPLSPLFLHLVGRDPSPLSLSRRFSPPSNPVYRVRLPRPPPPSRPPSSPPPRPRSSPTLTTSTTTTSDDPMTSSSPSRRRRTTRRRRRRRNRKPPTLCCLLPSYHAPTCYSPSPTARYV